MIRAAMARLVTITWRWPVATALSLVLLGIIICAIAALVIEEATDMSPEPFVAVIGVFVGVSVMMLVRKADERDR
ncbi:MAG: hypothetical protein ABW022_11785 [Actinoplanes sp.]